MISHQQLGVVFESRVDGVAAVLGLKEYGFCYVLAESNYAPQRYHLC